MEELPDFTCEMPGCLETFYSQCDKCCKKSFCKDHLDNHYSVDISQSQSSVIPEESASGVHSVIKSSDIMNHCTKVQLEIKKGKNKGNISMHFKCNYCSKAFVGPSNSSFTSHLKTCHKGKCPEILEKDAIKPPSRNFFELNMKKPFDENVFMGKLVTVKPVKLNSPSVDQKVFKLKRCSR